MSQQSSIKKLAVVTSIILIVLISLSGFLYTQTNSLAKKNNELTNENISLNDKHNNVDKELKKISLELDNLRSQHTAEKNIPNVEKDISHKEILGVIEKKEQDKKVLESHIPLILAPNNGGSGTVSGKVAYLTFDDGPSANTLKILDILDQYNVKATFFVNGNDSNYSKNIYKEIVKRGHTIGNHTYTHQYGIIYSSVNNFTKDFNRLQSLIESTTGVRPDIFRFPGGSNTPIGKRHGGSHVMKGIADSLIQSGYTYFDWNVSSGDAAANTVNKDTIVSNVLNGTKGKQHAIVLFHDSKPKTTTADALPEIIVGLHQQGYSFSPLYKDSYTVRFMK